MAATRQRASTGGVLERRTRAGRVFAIRFRADVERDGRRVRERFYVTLGSSAEGWTRARAEQELADTLVLVRKGLWSPPVSAPAVEEARDEPTLHEFASDWFERRRLGVGERTAECWRWALSHVLEYLADLPLSRVTAERVDGYAAAKVRQRERLEAELRAWQEADPERRGPRPPKPLANGSINRTLRVLAMVLDDAVEYGLLETNPARGRRRRLRTRKPQRGWLELDEVQSLLNAAGRHRALLATMVLAGLRVSELCALRWRAVDLARATLTVERSKTDAGVRVVDLAGVAILLGELKLHRAARPGARPDDLVFPTATGRQRDRHNVRSRILLPAVERANRAREAAGLLPIAHATNHTLRRTFCALLYDAGATPPEVMAQMGHESAALALEVYARRMKRDRGTGRRMDALVRGVETSAAGAASR